MVLNESEINALKEQWVGKNIKFTTQYNVNHGLYTEVAHWSSKGIVESVDDLGRLTGSWGPFIKVKPEEVTEVL